MPIFRSDFPQNARAGFGTGTLIVRYGKLSVVRLLVPSLATTQMPQPPMTLDRGFIHMFLFHRVRKRIMVVVKISRNSFRKKAEVRKASAQARAAERQEAVGKAPQCRPSFSNGTYHCPISFRYRLRASCQVGRGVKPFSTSLDLSRRLLKGRTALERPYSAVVTGRTVVVSPA